MSTNGLISIHDFVRSRGLNRIVATGFIAAHPALVRRVVASGAGGRPLACVEVGAGLDALTLICDRISSFPRPPMSEAMILTSSTSTAEQSTNG